MLESPTFAKDPQVPRENSTSELISNTILDTSIPNTAKDSQCPGTALTDLREAGCTTSPPFCPLAPISALPLSPLANRLANSEDIFPLSKEAGPKRKSRKSTADKIQQFFEPYSSPGPEEYPSPEDYEMEARCNQLAKEARKRHNSMSISTVVSDRLSWFKNKAFTKPEGLVPKLQSTDDPLLSLEIHASLFPHGEPDYMEPAAFHNLLANAEAVIMRFQAAYQAKCEEAHQLRTKFTAQAEELDESETRAQHLKIQLDDMSCRMAKNEQEFDQKLRDEQAKREELEGRWRMVVEESSPRLWGSDNSDSGFESEGESEPKTPMSAQFFPTETDKNLCSQKLGSPILFSSQAKEFRANNVSRFGPLLTSDNDLRGENQELKSRVAELEAVVDSCLLLL